MEATEEEIVNQLAPHRPLPCREDRQKILEQAEVVVAQARAIAEHLDRSVGWLTVERPAEGTGATTSASL
jgi:hypothetical protein